MNEKERGKLIADALRHYRVANDLTLAQLADDLGVGIATLHRIEKRKGRPNDRTLYKVLTVLPARTQRRIMAA